MAEGTDKPMDDFARQVRGMLDPMRNHDAEFVKMIERIEGAPIGQQLLAKFIYDQGKLNVAIIEAIAGGHLDSSPEIKQKLVKALDAAYELSMTGFTASMALVLESGGGRMGNVERPF